MSDQTTEKARSRCQQCGGADPDACVRCISEAGVWPHEFYEDVDDCSMCLCGVPALTHALVFPPANEGGQSDA